MRLGGLDSCPDVGQGGEHGASVPCRAGISDLAGPGRGRCADVADDVCGRAASRPGTSSCDRGSAEGLPERGRARPAVRAAAPVPAPGVRAAPRVLLVAPMSGHHATLLRGTVQDMVDAGLEVFVTDWRDARIVPLLYGDFDLSATSRPSSSSCSGSGRKPTSSPCASPRPRWSPPSPCSPPATTRRSRADDADGRPGGHPRRADRRDPAGAAAFDQVVRAPCRSTTVPAWHPGAFRRVYPGFLQLAAFISMNPDRHVEAHRRMFNHLIKGDDSSAEAHRRFYDEYLAVMDVPAELLPADGRDVLPKARAAAGSDAGARRTGRPGGDRADGAAHRRRRARRHLAPGQTIAAHTMCRRFRRTAAAQYLQAGVGHYGIFNGRKWRTEILPRIKAFIEAARPAEAVASTALAAE